MTVAASGSPRSMKTSGVVLTGIPRSRVGRATPTGMAWTAAAGAGGRPSGVGQAHLEVEGARVAVGVRGPAGDDALHGAARGVDADLDVGLRRHEREVDFGHVGGEA